MIRKTIARITSISQAAIVSGMNVEEMVNRLRNEVGQGSIKAIDDAGNKYNTVQPEWFNRQAIINTIDIREISPTSMHRYKTNMFMA